MTTGPIEFLNDHPEQHTPATEMGGASGLIQPPPHVMTPSEANSAMYRAAMFTDGTGDHVVDPATGLEVPDDMTTIGG